MNGCNKKQYRPTVDETKVPCSTYMSTDCIYPGDKVRVESLGLSPNCDMSDVLNAGINTIGTHVRRARYFRVVYSRPILFFVATVHHQTSSSVPLSPPLPPALTSSFIIFFKSRTSRGYKSICLSLDAYYSV